MLLRRQVSEERDEHIDMTPMVDVVFQLMTFMLFSVQMAHASKVQVPVARHGIGVEETAATFITLLKPEAAGGEAKVILGNGDDGDPASLDEVKKFVVEGTKENKRKVIIQADGAVSHGDVLKIASAIAEVEGVTIHIGVQEAQQ